MGRLSRFRERAIEAAINLQDKIISGLYFDEVDEYGEPLIEVPKARIVVKQSKANLDKEPKDPQRPSVVRVKRLG